VKPNVKFSKFHPQLSNNGHAMDGALMNTSSLWLEVLWSFRFGLSNRLSKKLDACIVGIYYLLRILNILQDSNLGPST
jgi:hypothetical protein